MSQVVQGSEGPQLPLPVTANRQEFVRAQTPSVSSSESSTVAGNPDTAESRMPPQDIELAQDKPWKYDGYPSFCEFVASSSDFFVLRRFDQLNTRVILHQQDEIVQLEEALRRMDEQSMSDGASTEHNGTFRKDKTRGRDDVLRKLRPLLKEYNEYVSTYSDLRGRRSARESQVDKTRNWLHNHPGAIDAKEIAYIDQGHDLMPLVPRARSWLRMAFDSLGPTVLSRLFQPMNNNAQRLKEDPFVSFASNRGINATITILIVLFGLAVLLGPMWWLNYVHDATQRLGIITGFVVFFAGVLAAATVEKPFEVLIGTAGYAAVLMVYLQQNPLYVPTN